MDGMLQIKINKFDITINYYKKIVIINTRKKAVIGKCSVPRCFCGFGLELNSIFVITKPA